MSRQIQHNSTRLDSPETQFVRTFTMTEKVAIIPYCHATSSRVLFLTSFTHSKKKTCEKIVFCQELFFL